VKTKITVWVDTRVLLEESARLRAALPLGAVEALVIEKMAAGNLLHRGAYFDLRVAGEGDDDE
jgi:hypothetical protein